MTSSIGKTSPASEGFTLIELALVALLLSVLVLMAAPAFQGTYRALALEEAARSLTLTLDFARETAIQEGVRTQVRLEPERGSYWVLAEEEGEFRRLQGRLGRRRNLPGRVRLESEVPELTFWPNGAGSEGRLRLVNEVGGEVSLSVDALTGRVARLEE